MSLAPAPEDHFASLQFAMLCKEHHRLNQHGLNSLRKWLVDVVTTGQYILDLAEAGLVSTKDWQPPIAVRRLSEAWPYRQ